MITADPIRAKAAKRAWSISPSPLRYGQVGPRQMTPLPLLLIGALRFSARLKTGAKRILMNMRWHGDVLLNGFWIRSSEGLYGVASAVAEENDPLGRMPGEYLWDAPGSLCGECISIPLHGIIALGVSPGMIRSSSWPMSPSALGKMAENNDLDTQFSCLHPCPQVTMR